MPRVGLLLFLGFGLAFLSAHARNPLLHQFHFIHECFNSVCFARTVRWVRVGRYRQSFNPDVQIALIKQEQIKLVGVRFPDERGASASNIGFIALPVNKIKAHRFISPMQSTSMQS